MANTFYNATGVLVVQRVTPVIRALFGRFQLDESIPGGGQVYIALLSEGAAPRWVDIEEDLDELLRGLTSTRAPASDSSLRGILTQLATHYGVQDSTTLRDMISQYVFDGDVELELLYEFARWFDDGHRLSAIKLDGCWHSSKPGLFDFGGNGEYIGTHYSVGLQSSMALSLGTEIDRALQAEDLDDASSRLRKFVDHLLARVTRGDHADMLRAKLASLLLTDAAPASAEKWFAVTGRVPGDDEDTCHVLQANDRDEALNAFETVMLEELSEIEREDVRKQHGQYVFVNSLVSSDAPISDLSAA